MLLATACARDTSDEDAATRGRRAIVAAECGVCHVIPGIPGARGQVGPSLEGFGARPVLAGRLPNDGPVLVRWLLDPPALKPATAMPDLDLSPATARDMAAYLGRLE